MGERLTERLAAQAINDLETALRQNPPDGTTAAEVSAVIQKHGAQIEIALDIQIQKARIMSANEEPPESVALKLTMAAGRALRSLRPARVERLAKIADAGEKGFAPHHTIVKQGLAAWTRELEQMKRWDLVVSDGWRWRLTPLGSRVLELAMERKSWRRARTRL